MKKVGFDNEKYLEMQSEHIRERIESFGGKLYLEFGGKLFDDFHAARVLPGFQPDSKLRMLSQLKEQVEVVVVISAADIEKNKIRGDLGITYDLDTLRLIDAMHEKGFYVGSVVLTQFANQPSAQAFKEQLENLDIKAYCHYSIEGYPSNVPLIVSEEGFGKNDYIETKRSLVVVTAPGPGSGKMATCLSQLYHEHQRGVKAGYAKFETFPIWNLSLNHPVNIAYEAATADLNDINMIDPWHLDAYGKRAVNYNRDVEIFPVLDAIFTRIYGVSPYKSPTDMGVNMAGNCIVDDVAVREAACQEIVRRYYWTRCSGLNSKSHNDEVYKIQLLMNQVGYTTENRKVVGYAKEYEKETGQPVSAIELTNGKMIRGKTSDLLGACSAMLLNVLKEMAGLEDRTLLISPQVIEPVQDLKINHLGNRNPRLHTDEVLLALAICAATDDNAKRALEQLKNLSGCEMHSTVILSQVDENVLKKLGINLTSEPKYQTKHLYRK